jgi:type I restriction enzyme S subunit
MSGLRSSWPEVPLGDVCEFKYGKSLPESARAGGDVPVFGSNGQVGKHDEALTGGPTIVIGRKGSFGEVNFCSSACWPIDTTYYVDGTVTNADLRWLAYRLAALGLNKLNKAAAVPGLNREDAYRQRLLLPPLPEQRRIAAILDKADALRAKRRAALAQLDTLTQSIFLDMFGDPATNPKGWPQVPIGDHASKIGSGATPRGGEESYKAAGITLIRSMNVRDGAFLRDGLAFIDDEQAAQLEGVVVEADDILLNITGASVARVCRAPADVLPARVNQHVAIIRPTVTFNPPFLEQCLLSPSLKERLLKIARAGATREAITKSAIEEFRVIRPPGEMQNLFAARVAASEGTYRQMRAALCEMDSLFASLQHRAFRGEL